MPNPAGFNGVDPVAPAYGERKRMGEAQKSAPLAGGAASASAQNAPRRARNHAVQPEPPASGQPAAPPTAVPAASAGMFWQQAATLPGFDPALAWLAGG